MVLLVPLFYFSMFALTFVKVILLTINIRNIPFFLK